MALYQTAHYEVRPEAVKPVTAAITEFVDYLEANEPTTVMYTAWQQVDEPTRFVHLFEFADGDAQRRHGASDAVRRFESVYRPELVGGPVTFTDYTLVARKAHR